MGNRMARLTLPPVRGHKFTDMFDLLCVELADVLGVSREEAELIMLGSDLDITPILPLEIDRTRRYKATASVWVRKPNQHVVDV